MRKIILALAGTVSGLVMLFSYYTSTEGSAATAASGAPDTPVGTTASPEATASAPTASSSSSSAKAGTFAGDPVGTRWGPVQVQVTVAGGRISKVTVLQHPQGNPRDDEINNYALPILNQETISAQSAQIDHVSGATDTSDGYLASLQSALDKAHL